MRLAHCADIHIRALSRHQEYRETFQNFIDDCRSQQVDHIFVGGDIFHTKTTGISPEYIDLLTWWLTEMSLVAPVHLILGNHDGNLVNMSRQDAVTPIVTAMANPRVSLYKQSGVYKLQDGINLCVFSLFDEEGWKNVSPIPGDVNIACYHGPVWGCKTETGWLIEDGVNVDFFNRYDFTLLGDIHRRQMLAYRNNKPIMGYSGTLIQQNYAEDLEHGYLIWDIESRNNWNVEFRTIQNLKPFVTFEWAGDPHEIYDEALKYPKGSRFRIKSSSHIAHQDVQTLSSMLKQKISATEVTFKIDQQIDKETLTVGTQTLGRADLRETDVLLRLIKDYHSSKDQSTETWQRISEQVKSYMSAVTSSDEVIRNTKWSLRNLEFDNLFAYGEGNVINFDKLEGIIGIFGANRIGKSSIVGSIMYALFNTTDRGPMKNLHTCNIRKPFCYSKAIINVSGVDYVIERQTTKHENKKGVISAPTSLNVFRINDEGEAIDLVGTQRLDTEKVIKNIIGNSDDFLMTSLSSQGEINQFIQFGSTKRRQTISRFLDLDIFDKMYDLSNKDVNVSKAQMKSFPEKDWKDVVESASLRLKTLEKEIDSRSNKLDESSSHLADLRAALARHSNFTPVVKSQVDSQRSRVITLENQQSDAEIKLVSLTEEIVKLNDKISMIDVIKEENDLPVMKKRLDAITSLESSIMELRHSHEKQSTTLKQQDRSMKLLNEVPCGDKFPTCKFIKDAHIAKDKIENQREVVAKSLSKLENASLSLNELKTENLREKVEKLQKLYELHSKLQIDKLNKQTELSKCELTTTTLNETFTTAKNKLTELEEALKNEENAEVVSLRTQIESLVSSISLLDKEKMSLASERGKISSDIDKLINEQKMRESLYQTMKVQELISSAFSKNGIPNIIITSQLPVINEEISKILTGIVDFSIELEIDNETEAMDIYINYGDSRRIIELASGMEKMISSIAIRVALINVSSLPKTEMFIIDEGFGALDDAGVEACNRLLASLKRYFKTVIVITHVDGVKDAADVILEITKNEKDSKVLYD